MAKLIAKYNMYLCMDGGWSMLFTVNNVNNDYRHQKSIQFVRNDFMLFGKKE